MLSANTGIAMEDNELSQTMQTRFCLIGIGIAE